MSDKEDTSLVLRWGSGKQLQILFFIAIAFSTFQIITAAFSPLSSDVVRAVHVGFLLLMVFGLAASRKANPFSSLVFWLVGLLGFGLAIYHWVFEHDLILRSGDLTQLDLIVGAVSVVLVFEGARRCLGIALPLICGAFLAYALLGEYLPGALAHRGYDLSQVIEQLGFGTEGIYGLPTYVSSSYIFLFILFGAFLEQAGMVGLFTNVSLGLFGHAKGGPAKVAVVSSAMMGTISGSGVANVVTTGQFTIPLMKKFGYRSEFAGGVEATSSMGGQLMPPVMGAVAFIMAETIGVPYLEICIAAAIPALLYIFTAFWMVHLEAGRAGLLGIPKSECPDPLRALKEKWYLIIPLAFLVFLLFSGFTPLFSGTVGLALTAIMILGSAIVLRLKGTLFRVVFWIGLGLLCAAFFKWGVGVFFIIISMLTIVCLAAASSREALVISVRALADGARHALPVGMACALVGVMIGVLTLTGIATSFAGSIVEFGQTSLLLSLVLTMLTCLVLGMGIPTIPNYIITSSIAAPALLMLDVPMVVSHMFVFYFGIMADLTPPVAIAAFAAAPIAKANGMKVSLQAVRIAIAGFIVPYIAVYSPELMFQGDWTIGAVVYVVIKSVLAIVLWGAASIGYLNHKMGWPMRIVAVAGAISLVVALPVTDIIGLVIALLVIGYSFIGIKKLDCGDVSGELMDSTAKK